MIQNKIPVNMTLSMYRVISKCLFGDEKKAYDFSNLYEAQCKVRELKDENIDTQIVKLVHLSNTI